jgi:FlaA1/EpsC-like NDP-sugar epimerase
VIGLRPGEKVREELVTNGEITATAHPMIVRALEDFLPWPELESNLQQLAAACENYDCHRISEVFALFLPGFAPRQVSLDPLDAGRVATPSAKIAHLTQFQRNRGPGD